MATPPNQMGLTGPVQPNDIVMRASEIGTTIPGIASLAMKSARKGAQRGAQGIYQLPSGQEPTPEFMNVSQQNLNNQTMQMTDMLNMMAPKDEQLAYINEQEAGILKLLGGSGEMTPQGIPTYFRAGRRGTSHTGGAGQTGSGGGGGAAERERERQAEAAANAREQARAASVQAAAASVQATAEAENNYGRPNMGEITGGYNTPTGDMPTGSTGINPEINDPEKLAELRAEIKAKEQLEKDLEDAIVTSSTGNVTSGGYNIKTGKTTPVTNVMAGGLVDKARERYNDFRTQMDYANQMEIQDAVSAMDPQERSMMSMYGGTTDASIANQMELGGYTRDPVGRLGGMEDRLGELTTKAKANDITSTELNELAQLNEFYGKNPTTGMGFLESLEYKVTNPEFIEGIKKAAPLLGAAALTAFAPLGVKSIFSIGKMLMDVTGKTPQSLRDTIQNALNKLTGGEKKALTKSLPSTYKGFGIQGSGGGGGEDRRAAEAEAERKAREEEERRAREEEENNREQDRFQRSFANRYFVGPASLDAVRKYATEGGYNQLTPFGGREIETV